MFVPHSTAPESGDSREPFRLTAQREFDPPLVIGVISDTHIYRGSRRSLPAQVPALFRRFGCGLIVHCGDANNAGVLEELGAVAPVLAVIGNNDDAEMRRIAPERLAFRVGDFRFAVVHGNGGASARAVARTLAGTADMVIYGHSHVPMSERSGESVLFNPGSATDRRWHEHFGIGLIQVTEARVVPEIVLFRTPEELTSVEPD
jgi:putative phosphoesterase